MTPCYTTSWDLTRPARPESGPKSHANRRLGPKSQANYAQLSLLGATADRAQNRNILWSSRWSDLDVVVWLARKDSNLQSPDPDSVARIRPREPRFEREAGRPCLLNPGESEAHSGESQRPIPKTERVSCPIWATQYYSKIVTPTLALDLQRIRCS